MSVFGTYFKGLMDGKGWDQRQTALKLHVRESTVHNWLHQDTKPGMKNVLRIAMIFGEPVGTVARNAGFKDIPEIAGDDAATNERARVLAALPRFAEVIDLVAQKPLSDQAAYIEIIRRLLMDRPTDSESKE